MKAIQVTGIDEVVRALSGLSRSDILAQVLKNVGEATKTATSTAIEKKQEPDTKRAWKDVKEQTKRSKWKSTLYRSGDLWREAGDWNVQGKVLSVQYGMEYAKFHQEGTTHIPQRKFIPTDEFWYSKNVAKSLSKVMRSLQL